MSVTDEKLLGLSQAKSDKLNKYSTVGSNPGAINNKSAEELQYDLGQALGHEVFTRDDGSKFQYALNADGTYAHDNAGNWVEQEFDNSGYAGNQRNLYIDDTTDGNYKLGLARSGTREGITPFEARYRNNEELGNPYQGNTTKLYDGTPGPKGVTPEDGALLDVTLPYNVATGLEYDVHSNRGQLANRAIGQGRFSKEEGAEFGSGKTEYSTTDAPLFNVDSSKDPRLLDDTLLPETPRFRDSNNAIFDQAVSETPSYAENLVDAAQAGVGTFAAKTADTVVDALLRAGKAATSEEAVNKVTKDFSSFNEEGDFVALDKYKLQTEYGYNPKNVEEASDSIRKAYNDPSIGNVFDAVLDSVIAGPEVLLTSAGDVLAGVAGPAGWAVYAGNFTNEILEERAEAKGGIVNLTSTDRLIAVAGGVPAALINQLSKGNVGLLEMKKGVQKAVKEGAVAAVKSGISRGVKSAIGEGVEEAAQEAITTVASKIQTTNQKDLMTDKFWEDLAVSAGLGFGAGSAASGIGGTRDALTSDVVKSTVKETIKKATPTKEAPTEAAVKAEDNVVSSEKEVETAIGSLNKAFEEADYENVEAHYLKAKEHAAKTGNKELMDSVEDTFISGVDTLSKLAEEAQAGPSEKVKTLGSDKSEMQKEILILNLIDALNSTDISPEQLNNMADNLGLSVERVKASAEKAIEVNKLAKKMEDVEDEVSTGARGFKTYINQFVKAGRNKDVVSQQHATDKITSFMDKQTTKANRYKSAIEQATKEVKATIGDLQGVERLKALGSIKGTTKVEGQNFKINHKNVAMFLLDGTRRGGLQVVDKIDDSVASMNEFLKENDVDVEAGQVTTSPTENKSKEQVVTQKTLDFFRKKLDETVGNGQTVENATTSINNVINNLKNINSADKEFIKADIVDYVATKPKAPETEVKEEVKSKPVVPEPKVEDEKSAEVEPEKPTETKPKVEDKKPESKKVETPVVTEPIADVLEENLKTAKVNQEGLEKSLDILYGNIDVLNDTLNQYYDELSNLNSDKQGLHAKIGKEKFELRKNETKLKNAQKHLKNKDIIRNKTSMKLIVARVKAIMTKIIQQVARLRKTIEGNKDNISGLRNQLLSIEQEIESIVGKITNIKEEKKPLQTRAKADKQTLDSVKESIPEIKEQIAEDVLETTAQAKDLFTVSKNSGLDLTQVSDKNRTTIKNVAKRIAKVINSELKTISINSLNEDTELFARVFVEEGTQVVKTRAGTKSQTVFNLNPRVAEMMAVEALMYGTEKLNDLTYNDDIQIKKMLGFSDQTILPRDVRTAMVKLGRFHSLEAAGLGKRVLKDIGVKAKATSKNQTQAKMESTLGGMLFRAMEDIGMVKYTSDSSFTTEDFRRLQSMVSDRNEDNASSIAEGSDTVDVLGNSVLPIPMVTATKDTAIQFSDKFKDAAEEINEELGVDGWVKTARTSKKENTVHEVRGMESELDIPKKQDKVLNDMENKEWVVFKDNIATLRDEWVRYAHKEDATEDVIEASDKQNKLLGVFGWKDAESVHIDSRDGVIAKNRVIKDSLKRLFEFDEKAGDKDFYFNWFFSKSGRFFMDSTEVNPQTDKLHRFMMGHKDAEGTVDSKETREEFKLAVVQAFDGSSILGNQSEDRGDIEVNGEIVSDLGSIDKQSMEESLKQFEAIKQAVELHDGDILDLIGGTDHPAHALMAVKELDNYSETQPFKTRMTLETDAVTSGFILGLLANPTMPFNKLKKWLAKGGVWLGGTTADSFGAYNGTKDSAGNKVNLDSYETGAKAVQDLVNPKLNNPRNQAIDNLVGGVSRKFMKAPFMTFIYGSSIDNIKASIGVDVADVTMQKLSDESTVMETVATLRELGLIKEMNRVAFDGKGKALKPEVVAARFRDLSIEDKVKGRRDLARTIYNNVNESVQSLHGEAVKKYMNNEFKEIVGDKKTKQKGSKSLINSGFVELYDVFKEAYDARVTPEMSTKEKSDVLEAMAKEGLIPGIFTVNSDRKNLKQRTGIVKKRPISNKGKVQIPFKTSRTLHPLIREIVEAPSSGAVLNIHWLDGTIISEVLGRGDALGIHDATLQVVGKATENSKAYSQNTWDMTQGYSVIEELLAELVRNKVDSDTVTGLKKLAGKVKENKGMLAGMRVDVEHMSMPGSKIIIEGEAVPDTTVVDAIEEVKSGKPIDITNMSASDIKGVVSEITAKESKVSTKKKDGTIKDKIVGVDIDILDAIPDEHC